MNLPPPLPATLHRMIEGALWLATAALLALAVAQLATP